MWSDVPEHNVFDKLAADVTQVTAQAIGVSLRVLVNLFNLFLIGFVIFALAGVSLYQNSLKRQCALPQGESSPIFDLHSALFHASYFMKDCPGGFMEIQHEPEANLSPH